MHSWNGTVGGYQRYPEICPDPMAIGEGVNGSALPAGAEVASRSIGDFFDNAHWW